MATNITERVIITLAMLPDHAIKGTAELVAALGYSPNSTHYVCSKVRSCKALQIIRGDRGRGHRTIYRLNRNSAGYPRRVR